MATEGNAQESDALAKDQWVWLFLWLFSLLLFLFLPCCVGQHRRQLCWRRIKERRWIRDDGEDEWFESAIRRQQEHRQRLLAQQRRFLTTRTQEDGIREQYLRHLMENYTIKLSESDIHGVENPAELTPSGSQRSLGGMRRQGSTMRDIEDVKESQCEDTGIATKATDADDVELEGHDSLQGSRRQSGTERQTDCASDDDINCEILAFDFDDFQQKIYAPLPGQPNNLTDRGSSTRRVVSSGCAICLNLFIAEENITWSANSQCPHIFHSDCVLHWYLTVGRKAQNWRRRLNPEMSDDEALSKICEFPLDCPCCRQNFCMTTSEEGGKGTGEVPFDEELGAAVDVGGEVTSDESAASSDVN